MAHDEPMQTCHTMRETNEANSKWHSGYPNVSKTPLSEDPWEGHCEGTTSDPSPHTHLPHRSSPALRPPFLRSYEAPKGGVWASRHHSASASTVISCLSWVTWWCRHHWPMSSDLPLLWPTHLCCRIHPLLPWCSPTLCPVGNPLCHLKSWPVKEEEGKLPEGCRMGHQLGISSGVLLVCPLPVS